MPDPIARPADLMPRLVWAKDGRFVAQPNCCFAHDEKLPFDGRDRFRIFTERFKSMPSVKRSIIAIASKISRSQRVGFLKDNDGLALRADTHIILHQTPIAEFNGSMQNFRNTYLEAGLVERR